MEASSRVAAVLAAGLALWAPSAAAGSAPQYQFELLTYPGADVTRLLGVRSDGVAIGTFAVFGPTPIPPPLFDPLPILDEGLFEYDAGSFVELPPPGIPTAQLGGVTDSGVLYGYTDGPQGIVFGAGGPTVVDHPSYDNTFLTGIDGSGLVYGIRSNDDPNADPKDPLQIALAGGFVFDGTSFQDLAIPGLSDPIASGVRSDGLLWGEDAGVGAYIFDGSSVSIIDPPGDETFTLINGVSSSGLVLGNQFTNSSSQFLFDGVDYHPFPIPGTFGQALGMNGDGVIWGISSLGSFIARPVPEPSTLVLLALGLAVGLQRGSRSV